MNGFRRISCLHILIFTFFNPLNLFRIKVVYQCTVKSSVNLNEAVQAASELLTQIVIRSVKVWKKEHVCIA